MHPDGKFVVMLFIYVLRYPLRDNSGINQIPLRVSSGEFNLGAAISFSPYAEVGFDVREFISFSRFFECSR